MKRDYNKILKEKFYSDSLKGNLPVFLFQKKGFNKIFALCCVKYGSINNKFRKSGGKTHNVPHGIAHFLEHTLFNQEYGNASLKFAQYGASDNALTSFETTSYIFSCADNFDKNLEVLLEFVFSPYLTKENVEREKGIIIQEILMYEDSPGWKGYYNLLDGLYKKNPVKYDISGTVESVQKITVDKLILCHRLFYNPQNMALIIAGDLGAEGVFKFVDQVLSKIDMNPTAEVEKFFPDEPAEVSEGEVVIKMPVSRPLFFMGFKDNYLNFSGNDLVKNILTSRILITLLFSKSSDFYSRVYEKGIIDETFSASFSKHQSYGFCVLNCETEKPERLRDEILKEVKRRKRTGFERSDFMRVKRKREGNFLRTFDSTEGVVLSFLNFYLCDANIFNYYDILKSITMKEVLRRLDELFEEGNWSVSTVLPEKYS